MSFMHILAAYKAISTFKGVRDFLLGDDPDEYTPPLLKKALAEDVDYSEPRFGYDPDERIYFDRHHPIAFRGDPEGPFEEADIVEVIDAYEEALRFKEAFRDAYHHWRKKALKAGASLKEK